MYAAACACVVASASSAQSAFPFRPLRASAAFPGNHECRAHFFEARQTSAARSASICLCNDRVSRGVGVHKTLNASCNV